MHPCIVAKRINNTQTNNKTNKNKNLAAIGNLFNHDINDSKNCYYSLSTNSYIPFYSPFSQSAIPSPLQVPSDYCVVIPPLYHRLHSLHHLPISSLFATANEGLPPILSRIAGVVGVNGLKRTKRFSFSCVLFVLLFLLFFFFFLF
jgi:hypothetical protein